MVIGWYDVEAGSLTRFGMARGRGDAAVGGGERFLDKLGMTVRGAE